MAESAPLLREYTLTGYRGFESLPLRSIDEEFFRSRYGAVRLAHLLWEQGVAGSNPATST